MQREIHHRIPQHLIRLYDAAMSSNDLTGESIEAYMTFEHEAVRYRVPVEITRDELARLIEGSTVEISYDQHRHQEHAGDWQRWGRLGGEQILRRYGREHFRDLARLRWKYHRERQERKP